MIIQKYPDLADLKKQLTNHVIKTLSYSTKRPPEETINALLSWDRAQVFYDDMTRKLGKLTGKKLLDIGCGYSLFLAVCLKNGIKAEGIEPANQEFYKGTLSIGREILRRCDYPKNLIKNSKGEKLPFERNQFDLVVSHYTLEHVSDVKKVLSESVRVLKPGGYLYFVVPNYGSFWEGHYGILWIPYLPKILARYYVRLWGKTPDALKDYQLISQLTLERYIKKLPLEIIDWGNNLFIYKTQKLLLKGGTLDSAKKILIFLNAFNILKVLTQMASFLKAQTPIVLIAKKEN